MKYTFSAIFSNRDPIIHEESWDTVDEAQEQARAWILLCGPDNPDILGLALMCVEGDKVWPYDGPKPGGGWQEVRLP